MSPPTAASKPARSVPTTDSGTGRGARESPTGLATRIVDAAAELLDETGSESAVTLRGVARRAGVTAPAIYGHYPDVASILLVVVQEAFAELGATLHAAAGDHAPAETVRSPGPESPEQAVARLRAVCAAYLDFAELRPQRYRIMFGGLWTATRAIADSTVDRDDVAALGQDELAVLESAVRACVRAGASTSSDPTADTVALWLGLLLVARTLPARLQRATLAVTVATTIGYVMLAAFEGSAASAESGTLALHFTGATLAILGVNAVPIMLGLHWRKGTQHRLLGLAGVLLGATGLVAVVLLFATFGTDAPAGLIERMSVYPAVAWQVLTAVTLLTSTRTDPRPAPAARVHAAL